MTPEGGRERDTSSQSEASSWRNVCVPEEKSRPAVGLKRVMKISFIPGVSAQPWVTAAELQPLLHKLLF